MTWDKSPSPTGHYPPGNSLHQREVNARKYPRRMRREARKELIYTLIPTNRYGTTMYGLAWQMGLSPSAHLMDMIWELVEEGRVVASPEPHRPNVQKWIFRRVD